MVCSQNHLLSYINEIAYIITYEQSILEFTIPLIGHKGRLEGRSKFFIENSTFLGISKF